MLLAVRISSYGCTWEVWRALKKLELPSAAPRATLTHFSCSPNFPRASITRYTHGKHEKILNLFYTHRTSSRVSSCILLTYEACLYHQKVINYFALTRVKESWKFNQLTQWKSYNPLETMKWYMLKLHGSKGVLYS